MEAVGFDLGETLIYYEEVPLSWKGLYREALSRVVRQLGLASNDELLDGAEEVLARYNTRIYPREHEVADIYIFNRIFDVWGLDKQYIAQAIYIFFDFFQQKSKVYEDAISVLKQLKAKGIRVGILTDVPYGMNKSFVLRDIEPFQSYIDVIVTSVDAGFRKPRSEGFIRLAGELGTETHRMMYVGNEFKDIAGANAAGMRSVLIDREGRNPEWNQSISLTNLNDLTGYATK